MGVLCVAQQSRRVYANHSFSLLLFGLNKAQEAGHKRIKTMQATPSLLFPGLNQSQEVRYKQMETMQATPSVPKARPRSRKARKRLGLRVGRLGERSSRLPWVLQVVSDRVKPLKLLLTPMEQNLRAFLTSSRKTIQTLQKNH